MNTDSQITEIKGRNWLINELLNARLEVAAPIRDHGIDLIAYKDLDVDADREPSHVARFAARPLQLKAATGEGFSIDKKFARFPDLLLVYVWHVDDPAHTLSYVLSYSDVFAIAEVMGWTATESWRVHGAYTTTAPSKALIDLLEPFKSSKERWWQLIGSGPAHPA